MTYSSRYHALSVALAAAWDADSALADVKVFDGPSTDGGTYRQFLTVGWTNDPQEIEGGEFRQDWQSDGGADASRNEMCRIRCTLVAWDGTGEISDVRARAWTYMAAIESVLRNAYALGVDGVMWAHIVECRVLQRFSNAGPTVELRFVVEARSII